MLEPRVAVRPQFPAHSSIEHTWGFRINFHLQQLRSLFGFSALSLLTPSSVLFAFPTFFLAHISPFPSHPPASLSISLLGRWAAGRKQELSFGSTLRPALGPHRCFCYAWWDQARPTAFLLSTAEPLPVLVLSTSIPSSGSSSGVSPERSSASANSGLLCLLCSGRSRGFSELAKHFCWKLSKL